MTYERQCIASIKSVSNVVEQFIIRNGGSRKTANSSFNTPALDKENEESKRWFSVAIGFLIDVVILKRDSDAFNRMRFENILHTGKKMLRICVQCAWNVLLLSDKKKSDQEQSWLNRSSFTSLVKDCLNKKMNRGSEDENKSENLNDDVQLRCKFAPPKLVCCVLFVFDLILTLY